MFYFPGPAGLFSQLFLLPLISEFPILIQDFVCFDFFVRPGVTVPLLRQWWLQMQTTHFWRLNYLSGLFSLPIYLPCPAHIFGVTHEVVGFSLRACLCWSSNFVLDEQSVDQLHSQAPLYHFWYRVGRAKKSPSLQNSQHLTALHCKHPVKSHSNFWIIRNQKTLLLFHSWLRLVFYGCFRKYTK